MPNDVKILCAVIGGAIWLILIRDHGHYETRNQFKRCLETRMELVNDSYKTADRICTGLYYE